MIIKIRIDGNPPTATAQQKGERIVNGSYIHHYEKKSVATARRHYIKELKKFAPAVPIEGPVELIVNFRFESASHSYEWKTTRPDLDNMQKLLADCMTMVGIWKDDSQVVKVTLTKAWCDHGSTTITVKELNEKYKVDRKYKTFLKKKTEEVKTWAERKLRSQAQETRKS